MALKDDIYKAFEKNRKDLIIATKFGYDIQFLEPPKSCGIPKVLNDGSIMSLYSTFWLLTNENSKNEDFIQKIDSFSNKIWYKRFVDLL